MTNYENLKAGKLYKVDSDLQKMLSECWQILLKLNNTADNGEIIKICKLLFGEIGENSQVLPPFRCDYGKNITIGSGTFINFNVSMVDVGEIKIGSKVLIGPGTGIFTAIHPIDPEIRATGVESAKPIIIEDKVWIGGNVTILPGVTIGKGSIIGAGSVVTKDIPQMSIAIGNPAKVIRKISEEDKKYWQGEYKKYLEEMGE